MSASVAVCVSAPAVPVNVTVLAPAPAAADATRLTVAGVPGVSVNEDGEAVTPAGKPVMATATGLLEAIQGHILGFHTPWMMTDPAMLILDVRHVVVKVIDRIAPDDRMACLVDQAMPHLLVSLFIHSSFQRFPFGNESLCGFCAAVMRVIEVLDHGLPGV